MTGKLAVFKLAVLAALTVTLVAVTTEAKALDVTPFGISERTLNCSSCGCSEKKECKCEEGSECKCDKHDDHAEHDHE